MAPSPTPLTAPSPKRILSPTTVKYQPLSLMSGGSRPIPMLRHSAVYLAIASVELSSELSIAAMKATG